MVSYVISIAMLTFILQMHEFETSDGIGNPLELVAQTFVRFNSVVFFPSLLCSFITYILVGNAG